MSMRTVLDRLETVSDIARLVLENDVEDWRACIADRDGGCRRCRRKARLDAAITRAEEAMKKRRAKR